VGLQDQQDLPDLRVHKETQDLPDLQALQEMPDPLEIRDPWDLPEVQVLPDLRGRSVRPERLGQQATRVIRAVLE